MATRLAARVAYMALLGGATHPALAQPSATPAQPEPAAQHDGGIADIVVTARRRAETIQTTPIAVTAFGAAEIAERSAAVIADVVNAAPGVTFDTTAPISGSSNAVSVFIRGIGQTDFAVATDPGVGIYLDGVYIARSVGGVLDLVDIERVEVLRGPQGTLFGKNTIGGAINVTTKRPQFDAAAFEGDLTYGRFNRVIVRGGANVPLMDNLAVRLSGGYRGSDGYARRLLTGQRLGGENNYTLRGAVRWDAAPNFSVDVSADYTHGDEDSPASAIVQGTRTGGIGAPTTTFGGLLYNNLIVNAATGRAPCQTPGFVVPFCGLPGLIQLPTLPAGTVPYDRRWVSPDVFSSFATGPEGSKYTIVGVNGTATLDLGRATLKSISAYREIASDFGRDPDGSPLTIVETSNRVRQHQFSQELQLAGTSADDRLKYLVGAFYFDERATDAVQVPFVAETFNTINRLGLGCTLLPGLTGAPVPITLPVCPNIFAVVSDRSVGPGVRVANESIAVFGEATYSLTPTLSLTAGIRWTQDEKLIDLTGTFVGGVPAARQPVSRRTFDAVTPRFILDWKPRTGALLYFSYSEGFKSGGFNQRYGAPLAAATSYEPEDARTFEGGAKLDLLDRRLRVNAAVFHTDYTNIQTVVFDGGIPRTINAAQGEIYGGELEVTAVPVRDLTVGGSYGYLHTAYTRLDPAIIGSFGTPIVNPLSRDYRFVNSPEHSLAGFAQLRVPLSQAGSVDLRADVLYRSAVFNDAVNTPQLRQGPVTLVNLRATYRPEGEKWSIAVFGTNLLDERYIQSGVADEPGFGLVEVNAVRPREWGVTAGVRF